MDCFVFLLINKKKTLCITKQFLSDITINDFANSSVPKNRTKKSSNNTQVVLKSEVEKNWDDKDAEDFDGTNKLFFLSN